MNHPTTEAPKTLSDTSLAQKSAVALRYQPNDLPRVVAKGKGYIAQEIIKTAESAGVPLRHDPALTQALSALEIQQAIPSALFFAVSQVLIFAFEVKRQQELDQQASPKDKP
jgi:flagellar biosynthesis protein